MRIIVNLCLVLLPLLGISQARRAQSLIEKEKHQDAYLMLRKSLTKDSLASAEKYVLSELFFNSDFEHNNLDSAYHYILEAIIAYDLTETKQQEALGKRGFALPVYKELKAQIEEAGFTRAIVGGKEKDFIDFLVQFNTSIHIDSAISLRNQVAYSTATKDNTYEAYEHFFTAYPQAKQVPEARKRYEKLLYIEKTKDGKLDSYQKFLQEFPNSWHRREAEQVIYNIITGVFTKKGYEDFIMQYPDSHLVEQAKLSLYSLLKIDEKIGFLAKGMLTTEQHDSITSLGSLNDQLLIPTIHNHKYQFINASGIPIIEDLVNISEPDKCQNTTSELLLASFENDDAILDMNGSILAKGKIVSFVDEKKGVLRLNNGKSDYFIHTGGFQTNINEFESAFIANSFIVYRNKSKWGLESLTGIPMLSEIYDSIYAFHNHLILGKEGKWGMYTVEHFYPLLDGGEIKLEFLYDQILVLDERYLMMKNGNETALMNKEGRLIIPMADQSIELVEGGYFIDRGDSILDSRVADKWYFKIHENAQWKIGDRGSEMDVYYKKAPFLVVKDAQLVGTMAARIVLGDSTFCFFNDTTQLNLAKNDLITPIHRMGENSVSRHYIHTNSKNEQWVYNSAGLQIDVGEFDKLIDLGENYILRRNKGSFDVLNNNGVEVLEDIDAATSLESGYLSYLADGKFGLFDAIDSTNINPKYDRPLVSYSDTLFIAYRNKKYGLIDKNDSTLVPLRYNEVRYLNDSIAVLSRDFRWLFWDIKNSTAILDNISDFWVIDTDAYYKVFKGIGYGIWSANTGLILAPTFSEVNVLSKRGETVFIAEKWVEEADLVVMLYYDKQGKLITKQVISTSEYENLKCKDDKD